MQYKYTEILQDKTLILAMNVGQFSEYLMVVMVRNLVIIWFRRTSQINYIFTFMFAVFKQDL